MRDKLEQNVADFIGRHGLFAGVQRVLLAVSGGADSTALLHILHALRTQGRLDATLICAHINHRLRGPASDDDERFVVAQAARLGLPAVTRAIDVRAHARERKLSIETAARQLRLESLTEIAHDRQCTWVSTGHQKNDNAETVLQRLRRGTGFRGLAGIRPTRRLDDLWLASPLLGATRQEILRYLENRGLPWREDHTNVDVAYTRNYIRHRLLPGLQREAQGSLVDALSELADSATRLYARVEREVEEAWPGLVNATEDKVILHAPGLALLPEIVAVELIRRAVACPAIGPSDLAELHYRGLLQLARPGPGEKEISLPGGLVARREQEHLTLSKGGLAGKMVGEAHPAAPVALAVPGRTQCAGRQIETRILSRSEIDVARIAGDKSPFCEYLDFDRIEPPVIVRPRRAGDRFQPLGMAGEKKVGKFLTTAQVPREVREQVLIFADRAGIVWVCPVRIGERIKITERTQHVLHLTVSVS